MRVQKFEGLCEELYGNRTLQPTPGLLGSPRGNQALQKFMRMVDEGFKGSGFHAGTDGDNVLIPCLCDPIVFSFLAYFFKIYYYF